MNHTSLWQRHIAWAKPKGHELKAYISSQYSTNMVLLSLLLGIQINIFFSSSPELVDLRKNYLSNDAISQQQKQHFWEHFEIYLSLRFWIGFLLILNICVTTLGILATFTTWSMISAISDRNAHCLIRSTIGQYVTTLPPRLVVASVYVFLLLFVLFIIDLVAIANPLLWILLVWLTYMFHSMVIRLSTFGRLILHTGAMSQRPVLSDELEKELLPTGLYTSLMIRAYHRRRKNTSVTNQYRRYQQQQQQQTQSQQHQTRVGRTTTATSANTRGGLYNSNNSDDGTAFASIDENVQEQSRAKPNANGSLGYSNAGNSSSMGSLSAVHNSNSNDNGATAPSNDETFNTTTNNDRQQGMLSFQQISTTSTKTARNFNDVTAHRHRRIQTGDSTLFLPPASILNMSLTPKEFKELIDNTIDTSSVVGGDGAIIFGFVDEDNENNNNDRNNNRNVTTDTPLSQATSPAVSSLPRISDQHRLPRPHTIVQQSTSTATAGTTTTPSHHHRRVSSSRFLLNEWAMESDVRNLYGASPPADLPQEITLFAEQQTPRQGPTENHRHQGQPDQILGSPSARWSPRRIFSRSNDANTATSSNDHWLLSPFSLNGDLQQTSQARTNVNSTESQRLSGRNRLTRDHRYEQSLAQPLLPSLQGNKIKDDEESVGALLGEALLPSQAPFSN